MNEPSVLEDSVCKGVFMKCTSKKENQKLKWSEDAEVDVYFEGVVATESNQRVLELIHSLRMMMAEQYCKQGLQAPTGMNDAFKAELQKFDVSEFAELSIFWQNEFQKYKEMKKHTEDQRLKFAEAVIRCAVVNHVLFGKPIEIQCFRNLQRVK